MARAYLSLGGNVGDSRGLLADAVTRLCDGGDIQLVARSSDYRTPPWGDTTQPPFVNLCISVETSLAPYDLLARAHEVERHFGRDRARERRWGPRTVDIDVLAYEGVTLDQPDLTLPHPRLLERSFVLVPLAEIAPALTVAGQRVADAAQARDASGIARLPPR